jgi:hypothetical protein
LLADEHDEDIVGVGVHGGGETPGPLDTSLLEHFVVGGLAEQDEVAFLHALLGDSQTGVHCDPVEPGAQRLKALCALKLFMFSRP